MCTALFIMKIAIKAIPVSYIVGLQGRIEFIEYVVLYIFIVFIYYLCYSLVFRFVISL